MIYRLSCNYHIRSFVNGWERPISFSVVFILSTVVCITFLTWSPSPIASKGIIIRRCGDILATRIVQYHVKKHGCLLVLLFIFSNSSRWDRMGKPSYPLHAWVTFPRIPRLKNVNIQEKFKNSTQSLGKNQVFWRIPELLKVGGGPGRSGGSEKHI